MKNDRLIKILLDSGRFTTDPIKGIVYLDGKATESKDTKGYVRFSIMHKGKRRSVACHRVIWISVKGVPKYGTQIDHKKGIKDDNRFKRLDAVTGAVNIRRAYATGLYTTKTNHNMRSANTGKFVSATTR